MNTTLHICVLKGLVKTISVTLLWYILFHINAYAFAFIEVNSMVSWVFLPAFIRLAAVVVVGYWGVLGLFIGTILTSHTVDLSTIAIASVSALSPFTAVLLMQWRLRTTDTMAIIATTGNLFMLAFTMAIMSSLLHGIVFTYYAIDIAIMPMFIGDLLGSVVMMYGIRLGMVAIESQQAIPKH